MFRLTYFIGFLMIMCFSAFAMEKKKEKKTEQKLLIPKLNLSNSNARNIILSPRWRSINSPSKKAETIDRIKELLFSARWGNFAKVLVGISEAKKNELNVLKIMSEGSVLDETMRRYPLLEKFIKVHEGLIDRHDFSDYSLEQPHTPSRNNNKLSEGLGIWLFEIQEQCLTVNYNLILSSTDPLDINDDTFTFELLRKIISQPLDEKLNDTVLFGLQDKIKNEIKFWQQVWPAVIKSMLLKPASLQKNKDLNLTDMGDRDDDDLSIELDNGYDPNDLLNAIKKVDLVKINQFIQFNNVRLEESFVKYNLTAAKYVRRKGYTIYAFALQSNFIYHLLDQTKLYPLVKNESIMLNANLVGSK